MVCGTATDGEKGKELILRERPDILLTDIRMPNKDGLTMIEEVRAQLPDMKVIIITGYDQFQYASRAIKLAVFDYILKPIRNDEVIAAVQKAMSQMQTQQEKDAVLAEADRMQMKAQLLSLLTNVSHVGQSVHQMMESAGLISSSYYIMILQPVDEGTLPMETLDSMDERLKTSGASAVSVVLYDSVVVFAMRSDTGCEWKQEARQLCSELCAVLPT